MQQKDNLAACLPAHHFDKHNIISKLKQQRLKTDLISNVSHDLKTPLTSMISYVDLLKKEGLGSENAPEYLRIIDEKTNRLKLLTENLFEAAKASSGAIPVNKGTIDLIALVNQSIGEMDGRFNLVIDGDLFKAEVTLHSADRE